jgi:assimilatory nitrate reductase electron transfer subunit
MRRSEHEAGARMRIVVVGNGMAGARLVSELRGRAPDSDVCVLGAEPHPAYNRILLSNLVAGKVAEPEVHLTESAGRGVRLRLGVGAAGIDLARHEVTTTEGDIEPYDRLVLATGSVPALPPIKGLTLDDGTLSERVAAFRTLDDCRRILALAGKAASALVLGGGLLGLEAARGLATRGLAVTVLHMAGHLMERQLDPAAGALLTTTLGRLGVQVVVDAATVAVRSVPGRPNEASVDAGSVEAGVEAGGVEAVLADGRRLAADLLVVACGVRPCTSLAEQAGIGVDRGILVDDRMRTTDRDVFAIGDCAQHANVLSGLVAPAWEQARVAADVLTGTRPLARYVPRAPVTRLKAAGIDLAAMGSICETDGDAVTFADPVRGTYAKLVIRDDRLAGAIMLGDNPTVGAVIQLFDRGGRLPADPRALLLGRAVGTLERAPETSPALIPDAAVICQCNTVSKRDIVRCWQAGARSTSDIVATTRAGTGCGTCRDAVDGIAAWLHKEDSA